MLGLKAALQESGIAKQTPHQRKVVDAVLFALWAQGHRERSPLVSTLMIPASRLLGAFVDLFYLPAVFLRRLPEFVLAGIFAGLAVYAFEGINPLHGGALFILIILILLKKQALRIVRNILFDIGDMLSLGALSRRYINRHFMIGPITIHEDPDGLKEHLFVSRILTSGPYHSESNAFQRRVEHLVNDFPKLQSEIEHYWKEFPTEADYWQTICRRKIDNLL